MKPTFSPYSVAMVTPFDADGSLSEGPVRAVVERLVGEGVPALLVSGSTGEQHSMTVDERAALYRWTVEAAGPIPVYAGVAAVRTGDAVRLARAAADAGAAGILLGFPPYLRITTLDARAYAGAVCRATDLPVMVYNNPLRTAFDLVPEALEALVADSKTVVAVKETGDPTRANEIKKRLGTGFQVFSGHDRSVADHWALGYDGLTSVAGNLWPREMALIVADLVAGRGGEARKRLESLPLGGVIEAQLPASLKLALRLQGLPGGWCREPLGHLAPEVEHNIERLLSSSPLR